MRMRRFTVGLIASVLLLAFGVSFACIASESRKPKAQLRFLLLPAKEKGQMMAVPAGATSKIPAQATLVTCDSVRFSPQGPIFANATIETDDQRTSAEEIRFSVADTSLSFSSDFKIKLKSEKGKRDFLKSLQQ